jgi:hypothetical protein
MYLHKRESLFSRAIALSPDVKAKLNLNMFKSQLEKNGPFAVVKLLRTIPLLGDFCMIDEETLRYALGIAAMVKEHNLALGMAQHLQTRGLIPQQELLLYIRFAKEQGMSDVEIICTLLFKGALSLKKEVDQLKSDLEKQKSDLKRKEQLLEIVPDMLDVAKRI